MSQVELEFQSRVMEQYPQGVYFDSVNSGDSNKSVILNSVVPTIIFDDKNNKRMVKFIKLNNLGKMIIDRDHKFIFETKPTVIRSRIDEHLVEIQTKTEQIVLAVIFDKLAKIAMVRTTLNPVYNILKAVYEKKLTKESLLNYPKREKYLRYIQFLCDLEILREQKERYSEGNYFIQIEKALNNKDEEEILNRVFGLTIKEGKTYLLNNLNINVLKPFIRIANIYYSSSALFENILFIKKENLYNNYLKAYGLNTKFVNFESYLDQLSRAKILNEDGLVHGDKTILEKVSDLMKKSSASPSMC